MPDSPDPLADYSDTERTIFDAALQVFAREGKRGARMQEIADAADINKAMLHYYFDSKDNLYDAVFSFTMRRFMASFGESLKEAPTFEETLRTFIDGYIEFLRDNQASMRLMVHENLAGGTLFAEKLHAFKQRDNFPPKILIETIESAAASGEIRPVDPDQTVVSVVSSCLFFFVTRPTVEVIHLEAEEDWDTFVEDRKEHVFDLIYHGLES
jgi:TetR/AcrR family transcriptional regulator